MAYLDGTEPEGLRPYACEFDGLAQFAHIEYLQWELEPNGYIVTEAALQWYRETFPLTDADIRRRIGRILFEEFKVSGEPLEIDINQFAQDMGATVPRGLGQVRILLAKKYIKNSGGFATFSSWDDLVEGRAIYRGPEHVLSLSEPEGVDWALSGFDENAPSSSSVSVEVTVNINVKHFIQEIRQLGLPQSQRDEAEDIVLDIQQEPTVEKVSRLMGMAANAQQLLPTVLRFIVENGHSILGTLR